MSNIRYLATKSPAVLELMKLEAYERRLQWEAKRQRRRYILIFAGLLILVTAAIVTPMVISLWFHSFVHSF